MPIKSVPVDADGDNDGVIDRFDSRALDGSVRTFADGCDVAEAEKSVFTVLKVFEEFEVGTVTEDTIVYSHPNGQKISISLNFNSKAIIVAILHFNNEYWVKLNLQNQYGVFGYAKCSGINYSIRKFIDDNNSEKWSEATAGFINYYFPKIGYVGIKKPLPRFTQAYSGPCAFYCLLMCYYYINNVNTLPEQFFLDEAIENSSSFWNDKLGAMWPENFNSQYISDEEIFDVLVKNLNIGNPCILAGMNERLTTHYVVVVGYIGDGDSAEDFIIVDPWWEEKTVTKLYNSDEIKNSFWENYHYGAHLKAYKRVIWIS